MKILKLNIIEFGCIKDREIILDEGLNVISGDNASGKSTVMLFIKYMFYGLARRSSKNTERERALSWDNHRAVGSMVIESGGKEYRIERRSTATARGEVCNVIELGSGEAVDGSPAELFLGVPAEVFDSSCAVTQMKNAEINGSQTAGAIENMLSGADESIDAASILEKLDRVRKEYKLNRGEGGILYDTEKQISTLKARQREATERYLAFNEMSARLARAEKSLQTVTESYNTSKKMLEQVNNARILQRFDELEKNRAKLVDLREELSALEDSERRAGFMPDDAHVAALKNSTFAYREAKNKLEDTRREYESAPRLSENELALADVGTRIETAGGKQKLLNEAQTLSKKASSRKSVGVALLFLGICAVAVAAVLLAVLSSIPMFAAIAALGVLLAVIGAVGMASSGKLAKARDAIALEYGVDIGKLEERLSECEEALNHKRSTEAQTLAVRARLDTAEEYKNGAYRRLTELLAMTLDKKDVGENDIVDVSGKEAARLVAFCEKRKAFAKEIYAADALVRSYSADLSQYDAEELRQTVKLDINMLTKEFIDKTAEKERFDRERMSLLSKETRNLSESLAGLRAGLSKSPVEIADEIRELEEKLAKDTEYYNALALAMQNIQSASAVMSGSVTPDISRRAGEMLSLVSGGVYGAVQTTKNFEVSVEQDGFFVNSALLSGGTRDAVYLCLRISLMQRLFGADLPPLLLDEALCQLDDARAEKMLRLLDKLCESVTQCLLFTCHTREEETCQRLGISANIIHM